MLCSLQNNDHPNWISLLDWFFSIVQIPIKYSTFFKFHNFVFVAKSLALLKLNYWIKVFFAILTTPIKWNLIIIHDCFVHCKIINPIEHSLLDLCLFTLWNHPSKSNDFLLKLIHVCFVHYKSPWTNWNFTIGSTFLHCENMHQTKLSSNITIVLFIAKSPPWLKLGYSTWP